MNRSRASRSDSLMTIALAVMATMLLLVLSTSVVHAQDPRGRTAVTWPKSLRAFQRGDTVRAGDFTMADTLIMWQWAKSAIDTNSAIVGWIARRPIAVGEFLRTPAVAPAPVITAGSTVTVLLQDGSLQLTLKGIATNNAALGAPVGVRVDKNRRLDGVAVGSNTVRLR